MYYDLIIPQFIKTLNNLNSMLDKAAGFADSKKFEVEILLQSRLAPDQFDFIRQVQIACDTAKLGASRLTGKAAPTHEDNEKSLSDLKARIESVVKYLGEFKPEDFKTAATASITQPRWEGKTLTGEQYLINHIIPNFYFHMTTAYAILRHNGIEVGKKDYLGAMPYKLP